ncbi:MAG: hypothetical protein ACW981_19040 [Candidatus Hodarchaeales archaeon]
MQKLSGILSILVLTIGLTLVTVVSLDNFTEENNTQSKINFKSKDDSPLTFSGLQNSSFYKIKGISPTPYPNEYFDVDVDIQVSRHSATWTNTTRSLVNLTNHDDDDLYVVFKGQGGNSHIKWIIVDFEQPEEKVQASIIWNNQGHISYHGDFETQKIRRETYLFVTIPGTDDSINHSIVLTSISIQFDEGLTENQIESVRWKLKLTPVLDDFDDFEGFDDFDDFDDFNDNNDVKSAEFTFLTESTILVLLLSAGLSIIRKRKILR